MIRMHAPSLTLFTLVPLLSAAWLLAPATPSSVGADEPKIATHHLGLDESSASCGKCHKTIYDQWKTSRHAAAWTNQPYKDWMAKKSKPESCHKCHIPSSILDIAPKQPKPREERLDEGVGCASCHVLDGKVHGPHGTQCEAHENVKSKLFESGSVDLCQSCHRVAPKPVISLGKDFEKSDFPAQGKNCRSCHMPEFDGHATFDDKTGEPLGEKRKVKSHAFVGASHEEMTAKAFELKVAKSADGVKLSLQNLAGHRLPGLELRRYDVRFALVDKDGKELTGKDGVISEEEPIKVGTSIDVDLPAQEGAVAARVRLQHFWQAAPKGKWDDKGLALELTKDLSAKKDG